MKHSCTETKENVFAASLKHDDQALKTSTGKCKAKADRTKKFIFFSSAWLDTVSHVCTKLMVPAQHSNMWMTMHSDIKVDITFVHFEGHATRSVSKIGSCGFCRSFFSYLCCPCLFRLFVTPFLSPVPCVRQHLSCGDCLEDKREDYQNCSVLYCVTQLCTIISTLIWAVLTGELLQD